MATKIVEIVFGRTNFGEMTPECPLSKFDGSFKEKFKMKNDKGEEIELPLYQVKKVLIPEWLDEYEWVIFSKKYCRMFLFGLSMDAEEVIIRGILEADFSDVQEYFLIQLLRVKNFKSEFRKSLREQAEMWLRTQIEGRKYSNPFSYKQWGCLIAQGFPQVKKEVESKMSTYDGFIVNI